jgi:hypothetical protein
VSAGMSDGLKKIMQDSLDASLDKELDQIAALLRVTGFTIVFAPDRAGATIAQAHGSRMLKAMLGEDVGASFNVTISVEVAAEDRSRVTMPLSTKVILLEQAKALLKSMASAMEANRQVEEMIGGMKKQQPGQGQQSPD